MAPTPKRSRQGPQSKSAPKKAKVLDIDLKLPREFSIFPPALRTSVKENWEADLLIELFDPPSDTEPHKKPHYSIRALDANNEVATVHGRPFTSLQKANFELMRLLLGRETGVWRPAREEAQEPNPRFVRGQSVALLRASGTRKKVRGWGFHSLGCLAFWEAGERGGEAVLTGLFVQRMGGLEEECKVEMKVEVEGD
jgi:hypothetical protein